MDRSFNRNGRLDYGFGTLMFIVTALGFAAVFATIWGWLSG
jgi:hypothetical protein